MIPGHGAVFTNVTADPARNARNAARARLKFHRLAVQRCSVLELIAHPRKARYFERINRDYFGLSFDAFVHRLIRDLVGSGAAVLHNEALFNVDA